MVPTDLHEQPSRPFQPARRIRIEGIREAWSWRDRELSIWFAVTAIEIGVAVAFLFIDFLILTALGNYWFGHVAETFDEELRLIPINLILTTLWTATTWCIDAGAFSIALNQQRHHTVSLRQLVSYVQLFPKLAVMATASTASWYALWYATSKMDPVAQIFAAQLIWLALGTPLLLTLPLMIDRGLKPVDAARESLKALLPRYPSALGYFFLCYIVSGIGALACFIGLFWTWPIFPIALILVYRDLFEPEPSAESQP